MHEQHRERVKTRFFKEGLENFEDHNVLELLLFYSIPRRDTNEIAHRLVDRFGSLSGVFEADYEELLKVEGIGANSASLIKLIPEISRRYMTDGAVGDGVFDTAEKIGKYFTAKFLGETVETVYMMNLTSSFSLISCEEIYRGSVNSSQITPRMLIEKALNAKASMVILAHNHPGGIAVPSAEDINTSRIMHEALSLVDVRLMEHFVVSKERYGMIMSGALGTLNQSLGGDVIKKFYGIE